MANRFLDSFDYYPTADIAFKWTSGSNQTIQSGTTRFGTGQALNLSSQSTTTKVLDSQATWTMGMAFRCPSFAVAGYIMEFRSGGQRVADCWLSTGGILSVIAYSSGNVGTTLCTGTHALVANTWYYIEFQFTAGATINVCSTTIKVANVTECTFAATSGGSAIAATTMDTLVIAGPSSGNYYFDDIYINDATGSRNTGFMGDIRIETIWPASAGYSTQWTPDTGSNFARVNETTENGDTSYVSTSGAGNIDAYNMGTLLTTPGNIFAVQANVIARKTDAGTKTFQILTRISSTNYFSSTYSVQDSYNFFSQIQETSPASGIAWTAAEINAIQMGIKLIA